MNRNYEGACMVSRFSVDWSVEGPLESMTELAGQLRRFMPSLRRNILVSLTFAIALVAISVASLAVQVYVLLELFINYTASLETYALPLGLRLFASTILLAFALAMWLFVVQSLTFTNVLESRFKAVAGLWRETGCAEENSGSGDEEVEEKDNIISGEEIFPPLVHQFNPLTASLSLIDEVSTHIPQVKKQLRLAYMLALACTLVVAIDIMVVAALGIGYSFLFSWANHAFGLGLGAFLLFFGVISTFGIVGSRRFLAAFSTRYRIISTVRTDAPPVVPKGKTAIERFEEYLLSRDERLHRAIRDRKSELEFDSEVRTRPAREVIKGATGKEHVFDIAYLPSERHNHYLLLVRQIGLDDISKPNAIEEFHSDVTDVIAGLERRFGNRPRYVRAVLLFDGTMHDDWEVSDDFLDAVKARPIVLSRRSGLGEDTTHVQLVVDEGEMYSFAPFLPERRIEREDE